ncbi:MAG: IS3 family transposase [Gammaproteobacteria bacterium]|nr:IS3 family transposase [Gammaproteobacteria bacterium]
MCRVYGVTRAGYYAWRRRPKTAWAQQDEQLKLDIQDIYQRSHRIYGSPRVQKELAAQGQCHSRKRVARLMAEEGLVGRCQRVYHANPMQHRFFRNIDKLDLDQATAPNQVWVGDVTYLKINGIWRYLAVVMDWYSRRIIGWSLGERRTVALTVKALKRAVANRHPKQQVVFHSDRGIEYVGKAYRALLDKLGFLQSINRPGKMNDNARMESFFGSLKAEWLHGKTFWNVAQMRGELARYIPFYNYERLHSSLDYLSPADFEAAHS